MMHRRETVHFVELTNNDPEAPSDDRRVNSGYLYNIISCSSRDCYSKKQQENVSCQNSSKLLTLIHVPAMKKYGNINEQ